MKIKILNNRIIESAFHRALTIIFQAVIFLILAKSGNVNLIQIITGCSLMLNGASLFEKGYFSIFLQKVTQQKIKLEKINYKQAIFAASGFYYYIFIISIIFACYVTYSVEKFFLIEYLFLVICLALNYAVSYSLNNLIWLYDATDNLKLINKVRLSLEILMMILAGVFYFYFELIAVVLLVYFAKILLNITLIIKMIKLMNSQEVFNLKIENNEVAVKFSSVASGVLGFIVAFLLSGMILSNYSKTGLYYQTSAVFSSLLSVGIFVQITESQLSRVRIAVGILRVYIYSSIVQIIFYLTLGKLDILNERLNYNSIGLLEVAIITLLGITTSFMPSLMAVLRSRVSFVDYSGLFISTNISFGMIAYLFKLNWSYVLALWIIVYIAYVTFSLSDKRLA